MTEWDIATDVVIVGSGGGGLCAALVARNRGLDVVILEKSDLLGGSTAMSGGGLWIPDNPVMRRKGVADSADAALRHFDAVVGDVGPASSPERRLAYVETAPRLVSFLEDLGVRFTYADGYADLYDRAPGGHERGRTIEPLPFDLNASGEWADLIRPGQTASLGLVGLGTELSSMSYWNRSVRSALVAARVLVRTAMARLRRRRMVAHGTALVAQLVKLAHDRGVEIRTCTAMADIVVHEGRAVGIVATRDGAAQRIRARQGVVLAAGGFSRNDEMRAEYGSPQAESARWSIANPGDTGEVLELLLANGAIPDLMNEAIWLPMPRKPDGSPPPPSSPRSMSAFSRARWRPGSIIVDAAGARFANESGSLMELGQRMFARDRDVPAVPSWLIFDDAFRRRSLFGIAPGRIPKHWFAEGFLLREQTLHALAARCGIDPNGLAATVQRFNDFARVGIDVDFERGAGACDRFMADPRTKPNSCLAPLAKAPYYAVAIFPSDVGTCGGVLTDEHARVLRADGTAMSGLYATGNLTATIMGRAYLGAGASIGPTCVFGYVAAQHIADNVDESPIT